jgi:hypothetical protein
MTHSAPGARIGGALDRTRALSVLNDLIYPGAWPQVLERLAECVVPDPRVAVIADLHRPTSPETPTRCRACGSSWPCPTWKALAADPSRDFRPWQG